MYNWSNYCLIPVSGIMQSRGHTNRFLYEFGARGIFPTGCLELGLIVVRFRRTLTLTLTKPSSKPSFAIHYLYSQTKSSLASSYCMICLINFKMFRWDFMNSSRHFLKFTL